MGGHLQIVAEFPDRPPVVLSGLAAMELRDTATRRTRPRKPGDKTAGGADHHAS